MEDTGFKPAVGSVVCGVVCIAILLHWWLVRCREGAETYGPGAATDMAADPLLRTHAIFSTAHLKRVAPHRGELFVLDKRPAPALQDSIARPVLLFIHGSCASMQQFEESLAYYSAAGFRVVAYDWLGCGGSAKPDGWEIYGIERHLEDLRALYEQMVDDASGERCVLIGHSAGTTLALRLAAEGGPRVAMSLSGVVLLGAASSGNAAAIPPIFHLPNALLQIIQPLLSAGFAGSALHPATVQSTEQRHRRLLGRHKLLSGANPMAMCRAYYRQFKWVEDWQVGSCAVPACVITGEGDRLTPSRCGRAVSAEIKHGAFYSVPKAGHQVMQEQPDAVHAIVDGFLASVVKHS